MIAGAHFLNAIPLAAGPLDFMSMSISASDGLSGPVDPRDQRAMADWKFCGRI